mmetsp:Transcript_58594/g.171936  ORF Transcript_58594/g.171936 Transcript_58594/m.171936 type:complete len:214 (+) Transcript_58594:497-1138(+)
MERRARGREPILRHLRAVRCEEAALCALFVRELVVEVAGALLLVLLILVFKLLRRELRELLPMRPAVDLLVRRRGIRRRPPGAAGSAAQSLVLAARVLRPPLRSLQERPADRQALGRRRQAWRRVRRRVQRRTAQGGRPRPAAPLVLLRLRAGGLLARGRLPGRAPAEEAGQHPEARRLGVLRRCEDCAHDVSDRCLRPLNRHAFAWLVAVPL